MRLTQGPSGLTYSAPDKDGLVQMFARPGTYIKYTGDVATDDNTGKYDRAPIVEPSRWVEDEVIAQIPVKDILHLASLAIRAGLVDLAEQAEDNVILGLLRAQRG